MKIRQLPEALTNKIAAGEVVERPASVVKELVENSIDANSSSIKVELEEAGLTFIQVTDDGDGMSEADAKHAFLRHATSKIHYDQDLFHIKSLGFRGEALASIASVSKVTITTSEGKEAGTKLYLEGGKAEKAEKSDARKGTTITVNELFYNTPARLKYMKSLHTELSHITDLMNRYAMAHTDIRFELTHNGKQLFHTPGNGNLLQVIRQIYGMQVAQNMLAVEDDSLDFHMNGFIAKPEHTRANRHYMTFIVNGRYIKSNALTHAILRGYDTLLPLHRYPIAVIAIELDPILVDVNVHPTKLEVRFSKEKELVNMLESLIRKTLQSTVLIPKMERKPKQVLPTEQESMTFDHFVTREKPFEEKSSDFVDSDSTARSVHIPVSPPPAVSQSEDAAATKENMPVMQEYEQATPNNKEDEPPRDMPRVPTMYPIGQLQGTYILAQNETGFYMIDQHAAQERIKYEFFKKKLGQTVNEAQQLLMPLTFEFTANEVVYIKEHTALLEQIGLFLEPFGGQTFAIRSYPSWFPNGLEEEIIRDLIEQIIRDQKVDVEKIREEAAILMSCKRSIKANHYLTTDDMTRLLEDLRQTVDPFTCPHGRPVIIHYTYYEIEKMFKRIM